MNKEEAKTVLALNELYDFIDIYKYEIGNCHKDFTPEALQSILESCLVKYKVEVAYEPEFMKYQDRYYKATTYRFNISGRYFDMITQKFFISKYSLIDDDDEYSSEYFLENEVMANDEGIMVEYPCNFYSLVDELEAYRNELVWSLTKDYTDNR